MRLLNRTKVPTELVRDVIRFVMPPGVTNVRITIGNSRRGFSGRAGGKRCLVRVDSGGRAFPRFYWPYQYGQNKGKKWWVANATEMLVILFAHELRHCWQFKARNKAGYIWGARGRYSELDTEAYALRKLREWRRSH
jgi:hypothetical protein